MKAGEDLTDSGGKLLYIVDMLIPTMYEKLCICFGTMVEATLEKTLATVSQSKWKRTTKK